MAKHQHPQMPTRPRQGSLGVWNSAHITVLCPANTTGYFTAEPWAIVHVLLGICCIPNLPRADIRILSLLSAGIPAAKEEGEGYLPHYSSTFSGSRSFSVCQAANSISLSIHQLF